MAINNYKHNLNEPLVVKDLQITGTRVDNQNTLVFTKSIQISADNTTGGGLILSDDGDFVDLNNGFGSFRFSSGIQIYNASRGGSPGITLASGGDINLLFSGTNINFSDSGTTTRGILGQSGNNDFWFFGGGATGSNAGFAQISTGDNGTEPIYVRQYTGDPRSGTLQRTAALLDGSGYTYFPSRLGIATDNPAETLHIYGRGRYQNTTNNLTALIDAAVGGPRVSFGSNGDNSLMEFGSYSNLNNLDTKARDLRIFSTAAPNAFTLQQSTGNIGINSTSPIALFDVFGNARISGITTSSRITLNGANNTADGGGQIFLNGITGNRIDFNNAGSGAPTFTTRSVGTKMVLWQALSGSQGDYALGYQPFTLWYSVSEASSVFAHRWYGGITQLADLKGSGEFLLGSTSIVSSAKLQVTGGAYVSDNVGVGTTNPFSGQGGAVGLDVNRSGALIFARNVGTSNESAVWAVDENFYSLPSYKGVGIKKHGTAAAGNVFGSIPNADLGTLAFQNTTNALIYTNGQTPIIFATASVERMRIAGATGNVGVSTSIARDSFQVGVGVTISSNGNATYTGIVTATGGIDVVGQSQLRRVAITTTSTNINMIAGRTYPYYSSITLTLPASPTAGDKVEIINRSGTSTAVVARNGSNIMGLAEDMTIDLPDVGFTLIYTVASDGWVIGK